VEAFAIPSASGSAKTRARETSFGNEQTGDVKHGLCSESRNATGLRRTRFADIMDELAYGKS